MVVVSVEVLGIGKIAVGVSVGRTNIGALVAVVVVLKVVAVTGALVAMVVVLVVVVVVGAAVSGVTFPPLLESLESNGTHFPHITGQLNCTVS